MQATRYKFRHLRDGRVIWASGLGELDEPETPELVRAQPWQLNALVNEGEQDLLSVYFLAQAVRTTLYLGLVNDTIAETDGLTDLLGEPSGNGYARQAVTRDTDWTGGFDSGDYRVVTAQKTFTASGGAWTAVNELILATTADNTGLLLAHSALSVSRTLQDGDSLNVTMGIKAA